MRPTAGRWLAACEGLVYARAEGSRERAEKIEVGGAAVVVARGEFRLP